MLKLYHPDVTYVTLIIKKKQNTFIGNIIANLSQIITHPPYRTVIYDTENELDFDLSYVTDYTKDSIYKMQFDFFYNHTDKKRTLFIACVDDEFIHNAEIEHAIVNNKQWNMSCIIASDIYHINKINSYYKKYVDVIVLDQKLSHDEITSIYMEFMYPLYMYSLDYFINTYKYADTYDYCLVIHINKEIELFYLEMDM